MKFTNFLITAPTMGKWKENVANLEALKHLFLTAGLDSEVYSEPG